MSCGRPLDTDPRGTFYFRSLNARPFGLLLHHNAMFYIPVSFPFSSTPAGGHEAYDCTYSSNSKVHHISSTDSVVCGKQLEYAVFMSPACAAMEAIHMVGM